MEVGAEIYYQIKDAEKAVTNVRNLERSLRDLVQTQLCNLMGAKSLDEGRCECAGIGVTIVVS